MAELGKTSFHRSVECHQLKWASLKKNISQIGWVIELATIQKFARSMWKRLRVKILEIGGKICLICDMFKENLSRCAVQSGNMFKGKLLNVLETPQEQGGQKNPSKNPLENRGDKGT